MTVEVAIRADIAYYLWEARNRPRIIKTPKGIFRLYRHHRNRGWMHVEIISSRPVVRVLHQGRLMADNMHNAGNTLLPLTGAWLEKNTPTWGGLTEVHFEDGEVVQVV